MLAFLIAALLLAVGAVGQVATIGTEAAENWAQRIRDPLVARVGSELVGRGLALAAAAPVRYGVPGVGLVLMFFVLKPRRRSGETDEAGDPFDAVVGLDARLVKKTIRQANRLARKGIHAEAAELLFACSEFDKAADCFVKAGEPSRAAEIRHDQNRFLDAAELYLEAGDVGSAATIFAQQEEFERAAECYLKVDSKSIAAEMFEKAGEFSKAGDCYRQAEFLRHAAQCYVKCSQWRKAADCLDQTFREENPRGGAPDSIKHDEMTKLVRQAAKLFCKADDPHAAMDILERGRCNEAAAQLAMQLHEHAKAAELFQRVGDLEHAAEAFEQLGEDEEAARLLGEHFRSRGDLVAAAEHLQIAGDHLGAGDLYRHIEDYPKAGGCYARRGEHAQAAEMYELAGDRDGASAAFERAGLFSQAAECCALSGQGEREAELLEKAGSLLEAGEIYHREGLDDQAILLLQRVDGVGFAAASSLLATIFRSRGQLSLAIKQLLQAIGDAPLDRETLPMYYTLATLHEENRCPREALEIYDRVMAIDYHHGDVEQRVARLRGQTGTVEPALPVSSGTPPAVRIGSPSGRYEIVGELGRGGMGIVYKAHDTVLDRLVAFKVLPRSFEENPRSVENFLREAKAAAKLNHPNIVTVYDAGEQDGHYYIAMEYVDGTTLKEILRRRGPIAPNGVMRVVMHVCEALAYAHEKKVVHRDIKTANAMWTRDSKAKIMDFGLAKVVEEVRNHTTVVSGTPHYMSPEQTLGKNVDHRTDIYSLGVAAFELITGRVPFKEGNIPYHHVHTPPPDVRSVREDVSEDVARLIARCLEKDVAERYQSASEILREVRAVLAG
jgi:tetratricopeptide (TPR) repeat protein